MLNVDLNNDSMFNVQCSMLSVQCGMFNVDLNNDSMVNVECSMLSA